MVAVPPSPPAMGWLTFASETEIGVAAAADGLDDNVLAAGELTTDEPAATELDAGAFEEAAATEDAGAEPEAAAVADAEVLGEIDRSGVAPDEALHAVSEVARHTANALSPTDLRTITPSNDGSPRLVGGVPERQHAERGCCVASSQERTSPTARQPASWGVSRPASWRAQFRRARQDGSRSCSPA
jgi:hypothetical protein